MLTSKLLSLARYFQRRISMFIKFNFEHLFLENRYEVLDLYKKNRQRRISATVRDKILRKGQILIANFKQIYWPLKYTFDILRPSLYINIDASFPENSVLYTRKVQILMKNLKKRSSDKYLFHVVELCYFSLFGQLDQWHHVLTERRELFCLDILCRPLHHGCLNGQSLVLFESISRKSTYA